MLPHRWTLLPSVSLHAPRGTRASCLSAERCCSPAHHPHSHTAMTQLLSLSQQRESWCHCTLWRFSTNSQTGGIVTVERCLTTDAPSLLKTVTWCLRGGILEIILIINDNPCCNEIILHRLESAKMNISWFLQRMICASAALMQRRYHLIKTSISGDSFFCSDVKYFMCTLSFFEFLI